MKKSAGSEKSKKFTSQKILSYALGFIIVFFVIVIAHKNKAFGCACGFSLNVPAAFGCSHDSPPPGGGIAPDPDNFDKSIESSGTNDALSAFCWDPAPKNANAPVTLYWDTYRNVHLQIYDSKGEWWFNDWVRSNSYTVFSKDNKIVSSGIPLDGRTIYTRISSGRNFSETSQITCSR